MEAKSLSSDRGPVLALNVPRPFSPVHQYIIENKHHICINKKTLNRIECRHNFT